MHYACNMLEDSLLLLNVNLFPSLSSGVSMKYCFSEAQGSLKELWWWCCQPKFPSPSLLFYFSPPHRRVYICISGGVVSYLKKGISTNNVFDVSLMSSVFLSMSSCFSSWCRSTFKRKVGRLLIWRQNECWSDHLHKWVDDLPSF